MIILIIGGSKSGKSHLAQRVVKALAGDGSPGCGPMIYWATMEPTDGEDRARIEKHIADRAGWGFETVERGRDIARLPIPCSREASVLFDSVTALVTNELFGGIGAGTEPDAEDAKRRSLEGLIRLSESVRHFVCVADDVFRDGFSFDGMTETWRRALAEVVRGFAEHADTVLEVSCGLAKIRKGVMTPLYEEEK